MLPVDVLRRVLLPYAGDASTLCAAACVATTWRDAATLTPSLWRQLRLQRATLECLTDERLVRLVARAGGELEQLSGLFLPDTRVTVRGVAAALRGHDGKLTQLIVRGVKRDAEDGASAADVEALLRSFLRNNCAYLDLDGCAFCCGLNEEDKPCGRLCSRRHDTVCDECDIVYCQVCAERAKRDREAPCGHVCTKCLRHAQLYWCDECEEGNEACCRRCKCYCGEEPPCVCGHARGDRFFCCLCDTAYCEECWLGRSRVLLCDACSEFFCADGCATFVHCHGADDCVKKYCQHCAPYWLQVVDGAPLCAECVDCSSSDEDAEEEEEEEEEEE
jgi:hypothetical protein